MKIVEDFKSTQCQETDHQLRYSWQVHGINVFLFGFTVQIYGRSKPAAPFQYSSTGRGKGQPMWHHDLILTHAVTRSCSVTCWEEVEECHAQLGISASIWLAELHIFTWLVLIAVVPSWAELNGLLLSLLMPQDEMWGYFRLSYVCLLFIRLWQVLLLIVHCLMKTGSPLCFITLLLVSMNLATACIYTAIHLPNSMQHINFLSIR